ncbi:MAG: FemAB family XrtA/PEP-CTERM system-associated protein [Candidatus Omnitrophota bacterium]|jgi:FemAB-related protein (PEP-CTERM system-associated)
MDGIGVNISDGKRWDEYVLNHPRSFFYHLHGWGEALEDVFGFKKLYVELISGGKIRGVLPLVLVDTFFNRYIASIPIGVYAGALADTDSAELALIEKAAELTKEYKCSYLELRNMRKVGDVMPSKELYATFIKELPNTKRECLERLPRKARSAARHAIDSGLQYNMGFGQLKECYDIYAVNQRSLGSPVVSAKWFEKLAEVFKDRMDILTVRYHGRCIASVLTFFYKDTVLPFYGGCMPESFKLEPNNYMYLKLQEHGVEKGLKYFDFGRSRRDSGSYRFKINQGFEPVPLHYQYYLNRSRNIPYIDPSNGYFDTAKMVWKRLPVSFTKWLGPKIFKFVVP